MLNLESLFAATQSAATAPSTGIADESARSLEPSGKRPDHNPEMGGQVGHSGHNQNAPFFDEVCPRESLQHKAFSGLGTLGTLGTVDFQGGEGQEADRAPGGGAARKQFALHPGAVILALAYCRKVKASNDETVSALLSLEATAPGEQVKVWHSACIDVGIKPWEVLTIPAPASGLDCTMCKHLTTRQLIGIEGRRQFHWACRLGYLILETGRSTERIWMAPPECRSYERWQPGAPVASLK